MSHSDGHDQVLVPLWIGIFLQNFSADLKDKKNKTYILNVGFNADKKKVLEILYRFSSEVDFHHRVHQVLPVGIESEDLLHPVHEGIVHCGSKTSHLTVSVLRGHTLNSRRGTDFEEGLPL